MAKKTVTERTRSSASQVQEDGETARKVWLAGIGAYGRAISEAQESLSRFGAGTSKLFEELVRHGEEIEERFESRKRDLSQKVGNVGALSFQERVNDMREKLKRRVSGADDERLTEIEARLDRIERLLIAGSASPAPVKRKAVRRSASRATGSDE